MHATTSFAGPGVSVLTTLVFLFALACGPERGLSRGVVFACIGCVRPGVIVAECGVFGDVCYDPLGLGFSATTRGLYIAYACPHKKLPAGSSRKGTPANAPKWHVCPLADLSLTV